MTEPIKRYAKITELINLDEYLNESELNEIHQFTFVDVFQLVQRVLNKFSKPFELIQVLRVHYFTYTNYFLRNREQLKFRVTSAKNALDFMVSMFESY